MRKVVTVAVLALFAVSPALAEDINPPSWRGNPLTTWQQWEFLQPGVEGPTDVFTYPQPDGGDFLPTPVLTHIPGPGAGWHEKQPTAEFGQGIYDPADIPGDGWVNLSGELIIDIPNFSNNNPRKVIWIQLVWEPQADGSVPVVQILDPAGGLPTSVPLARTELWPAGSDQTNLWRQVNHDTFHLELFPNPDFEQISISGGINVDELVIDTWCVPEPATMSFLGVGALALIKRRKRRC